MAQIIKLKRGLFASLPSTGLNAGEPLITTDRGTLHYSVDSTTLIPVVPAIEDLTAIGTVTNANDLLIIHDADGTGQKEKKITVSDLVTAIGGADEKVAVISGGTAGYIWGTDGTDGILRVGSSITYTKDAGNGYVTVDVGTIDGGTF